MKQLKTVAKIGKEAKLFSEAEIDMSVHEIMSIPDLLLFKLVENQINKTEIMKLDIEN